MAKRKHYVNIDKIYNVELIEKRGGKTLVRFTAPIDGKKQTVELSEEEYGLMLAERYYEK